MIDHSAGKSRYSNIAIYFIAVLIIAVFFSFNIWNQNRITIDVPSYYTYLPSTFIYHDLKLNFIDQQPEFFADKIWFYKIENGNRLIKHSMGLSVALLPFFLIGHTFAYFLNTAQDGYSMPYQNALSIGVLIYFITGLYFLKKILLRFFSDQAVAVTILSIGIGTNLLYYLSFEGLMTHGVGFSLLCICVFTFFNWIENSRKKYFIFFSIAFGIILLIRPLAISLLFYFIIYGIIHNHGVKNFFIFIKNNFKIIVLGKIIVIALLALQFSYWKYITGHWWFDAYIDEHFIFSSPQIIPFLFSFRKGLFVYTPLLIFIIPGFYLLLKKHPAVFYSTLISISISIFIFSSWWAWSYGFCFGMRPMIDSYSLLSFPLAAFFDFIFRKNNWLKWLVFPLTALLIVLNLFQTWQYKNGLIHFDYMTRKSYFKGFFQTKANLDWYDALSQYDWERRKKGLPQIEYSKKYFFTIDRNTWIYFRGFNLCFISVNENRKGLTTCSKTENNVSNLFHLIHYNGDTISLQSSNGKFLSVKNNLNGVAIADVTTAGYYEKFIFNYIDDDDNKINLQTLSGKFLFVNPQEPFVVYSSDDPRAKQFSIFRYFVYENNVQ